MSGIRHKPNGVQRRLQNVSGALRNRNYRIAPVGAPAGAVHSNNGRDGPRRSFTWNNTPSCRCAMLLRLFAAPWSPIPEHNAGAAFGCYTDGIGSPSGESVEMSKPVIVVHYHEIWLKGGNRRFFLSKLHMGLKRALEGLPVERILRPGDRMLIEFGEGASVQEAVARIERVFGVAF